MAITPRERRLVPVMGTGHTYTLDGRPLVSVTRVIGSVLRAPELEQWYKRVGMQADAIRDEAAAFGKSVHIALAAYARGDRLLDLDLPEQWRATVEAGRRWIDKHIAEVYAVEEPVASERYGYAGTPDLYGRRVGRKTPVIVDWKTTGALYPSHRAQLAAYRQAAKETYGMRPAERIIVRFSKDEPGRVATYPLGHPETDFALFSYLLGAYRILKTMEGGI